MGTLTEYFRYLNADPKFLNDTKETFSHLRVTKKHKKPGDYENKKISTKDFTSRNRWI